MRTDALSRLVLLSVSTLRMPSTKETNWLRGMKYSCRMSVSLGSELRKYGTESCIGSFRVTRQAAAGAIARAPASRRSDRLCARPRAGLHAVLDVLFRQPLHFLKQRSLLGQVDGEPAQL